MAIGGGGTRYRRLPKFVGRPMGPGHSKTEYGLIKLEQLNKMPDNSEIDYAALMEAKVRIARAPFLPPPSPPAHDSASRSSTACSSMPCSSM